MTARHRIRLASLALLVVASLLLAGCPAAPTETSAPEAAEAGEVVKIGFMAASTGGAAFLGGPEREAAMMLKEQLAGQEFTAPDGTPRTIEIVEYDTEGSGDVAIPLAKKLIDNDQAAVIVGGTRSPVSLALVPIMQEAEIPVHLHGFQQRNRRTCRRTLLDIQDAPEQPAHRPLAGALCEGSRHRQDRQSLCQRRLWGGRSQRHQRSQQMSSAWRSCWRKPLNLATPT